MQRCQTWNMFCKRLAGHKPLCFAGQPLHISTLQKVLIWLDIIEMTTFEQCGGLRRFEVVLGLLTKSCCRRRGIIMHENSVDSGTILLAELPNRWLQAAPGDVQHCCDSAARALLMLSHHWRMTHAHDVHDLYLYVMEKMRFQVVSGSLLIRCITPAPRALVICDHHVCTDPHDVVSLQQMH